MAGARELIQGTHDTWNRRDLQGYRDLASADMEMTVPGGSPGTGSDGLEQLYRVWNEAFPDNVAEILGILTDGDTAALEGVITGTHTGIMRSPTGDLPPTGRRVRLGYSLVIRAGGGRMTSYHLYFDRLDFLTQLGVMPSAVAAAGTIV
jgi:ketosteroid isomerase-like protein